MSAEIRFRTGDVSDLPTFVSLLADDPLGAQREAPTEDDAGAYERAFAAIEADPNHEILVAELEGAVAGFLQLSYLPHLTYTGGWRAQIEGVRVDPSIRSRGIGRALIGEAVDRARTRGCHLVQLTTDQRRPDAIRFYEGLGFEPSHVGMKLHFNEETDGGAS